MSKQILSVVVPCYNEEENIHLCHEEIVGNIETKRFDYEIIFVNDGSRDDTWAQIQKIVKKDAHARGVNFSRNFGHQAALQAGLEAAAGDVIIMMDGDLQHPPSLFGELIAKYDEGFDIVNTVRQDSEDVGALKKMTSRLFYKIINGLSDLQLNEGEADYRLMSRRALDTLNALPESPKFYRGLVNWIGYDVARVEYRAKERQHGKSSYTLKKMIELARLGITSFSMKPLKVISVSGMLISGVAIVLLIGLVIVKFMVDVELVSYSAILTALLMLMMGILITVQGVVAVYLVDIFSATKSRPTYIVKESANGKK